MNQTPWDIGVCSWCVQPKTTADAIARVRKLGLRHLQLALRPMLFRDEKESIRERTAVATSGMVVTSAMIDFPMEDASSLESIQSTCGLLPDEDWEIRKLMVHQASALAVDLGVNQLSLCCGYISSHRDDGYVKLVGRVQKVASMLVDYRMDLLLENAAEYPDTLARFINDVACSNVFVSFDTAAPIIYGSADPADAIETLAGRIRQVQLRDAVSSDSPGETWGKEVELGKGELQLDAVLEALREVSFGGHLLIERNVKKVYMTEIAAAIRQVRGCMGNGGDDTGE